jgi:hypothetical protein
MYYRGTNEVNLTDRAITDPNGNYFWSRHNGCDTIATVDTISSNGDQIIRESYLNCQDSTETIIMNVVGNSHTWHASATNEFWKFLRKYNKCAGVVTTGVSNIQKNEKLEIYPNPANTILFIKTEDNSLSQYQIFNSIGQVMKKGKLTENSVDVSGLPKGIYFIQLNVKNGQMFNSKFIKD